MDFEDALRRVYLGRSIAFMGAGFSAGLKAIKGEIPYGFEFAAELAKKAGEPTDLPLDLASSAYEQNGCQPELSALIPERFTTAEDSDAHALISSLPWRRIYTTNYDNVIEASRAKNRLAYDVATARDKPIHHTQEFTIVHLHGFVGRLTPGNWDEQTVLTNEQYASDILRNSGWIEMFRNDVQYADSIIFFGYGVADIDVARLLYANPSLKGKTFFCVGAKAPRSVEIRAGAYGSVLKLETSDVAAMVPSPNDPKVPKPSPFLAALKQVEFSPSPKKPSREDVVDLLVKGDVRPEFLARDLINGTNDYYVSRDEINRKSEDISKPVLRWFVHGGLGEGKSLALFELASLFISEGRTVYALEGDLDGFANDIDFLSSLDSEGQQKVVIFVENAISLSTELKGLINRFPLISFVITNRSAVLQTRVGDIAEDLGDEFELIDISLMSDEEIDEFSALLYENGLWGDEQGRSRADRSELIRQRYKRSMASVLLDVCKSSDIFTRISHLFGGIDKNLTDAKKAIIIALALSYAGSRISVSQLCEIAENDIFKYGMTQRNVVVREFFDIERNVISVRSSAFAQAVLKEAVSDSILIEYLPSVISRLDRLRSNIRAYDEPIKQMMRFGFIERILRDDNQKEQKLVAYFEGIRSTGVGVSNPQFWLQYAISCMAFQSYKDAGDHFDTAFGLARNKGGYDPYQIENTYSRFLLESRARTENWNDYYDVFLEAHEILEKQMASVKEGYYPYRVSRLYLEFVEARIGTMDRTQKQKVRESCDALLALSERAPQVVRRSRYWREARVALGAARDIVDELI